MSDAASLRLCARCGLQFGRPRHRYCAECFAAYTREWRKKHPDRPTYKANARSYAGVYKRNGKLIPQPCAHCGDPEVQMHHPDYGKPLEVEWLCRPCHLSLHKDLSADVSRVTIKRTDIHSIGA